MEMRNPGTFMCAYSLRITYPRRSTKMIHHSACTHSELQVGLAMPRQPCWKQQGHQRLETVSDARTEKKPLESVECAGDDATHTWGLVR